MKKLLFGVAALFMLAACNGNGTSENDKNDSALDSTAQVAAAQASSEQARMDSLRQDSIAKAEEVAKASSKYDNMVNQFAACVNKMEKSAKKYSYANMQSYMNQYSSLEKKLNKVKNELSPEQLEKVQKTKKKFRRLMNGTIAG